MHAIAIHFRRRKQFKSNNSGNWAPPSSRRVAAAAHDFWPSRGLPRAQEPLCSATASRRRRDIQICASRAAKALKSDRHICANFSATHLAALPRSALCAPQRERKFSRQHIRRSSVGLSCTQLNRVESSSQRRRRPLQPNNRRCSRSAGAAAAATPGQAELPPAE